jgi:rhamnose utilization protein RhaD (predicted bifunctional aldolase and dehydrogenase)/NAD(P)-dependent dehydrogenase (short-subunit alcohol dehydrogenase family)
MKNLWNNQEAQAYSDTDLQLRVYSSRLLGQEPSLVLHGGGNTSVKVTEKNIFGDKEDVLCVKGSGWDLATIEPQGFAPVRMETLLRLASLEKLSDTDMVRVQKSAMTNPDAPAPSVEAILHAIIPFKFVDHTHADAVVAITNTPGGDERIRSIYGNRVLYIPYVMPGFILARKVFELTRDVDWQKYEGMVLLNHGIFSFGETAKQSYDRMIDLVTKAEEYLQAKKALDIPLQSPAPKPADLKTLAHIRKSVARYLGAPVIVSWNSSPEAVSYSCLDSVTAFANQGPLTPDHVIHTKRVPVFIPDGSLDQVNRCMDDYALNYQKYFEVHGPALENALGLKQGQLKCLDKAPRWAVWPGHGVLSFGNNAKRAEVISDITRHTLRAQQWSEALGGWKALPQNEIFEVEYWELEQAKLKRSGAPSGLQGKVALVTGAAGGIGKACVDTLRAQGAAVVAIDLKRQVLENWKGADVLALVCDLTDSAAVKKSVDQAVARFGGLDIVVANAGLFPKSQKIEDLDDAAWSQTLSVNLTSQMYLFRECAPYLALGFDPTIVVVASKNVPAPGPGAAAYSASKAGMTQLARVAALELGSKGIRVNMVHPHAVMDTALWTPELLEARAKSYNMSVDEYKKNNLLKVEVRSKDVADLVASLASPLFAKVTGAQIAIDGGSDRII